MVADSGFEKPSRNHHQYADCKELLSLSSLQHPQPPCCESTHMRGWKIVALFTLVICTAPLISLLAVLPKGLSAANTNSPVLNFALYL